MTWPLAGPSRGPGALPPPGAGAASSHTLSAEGSRRSARWQDADVFAPGPCGSAVLCSWTGSGGGGRSRGVRTGWLPRQDRSRVRV